MKTSFKDWTFEKIFLLEPHHSERFLVCHVGMENEVYYDIACFSGGQILWQRETDDCELTWEVWFSSLEEVKKSVKDKEYTIHQIKCEV